MSKITHENSYSLNKREHFLSGFLDFNKANASICHGTAVYKLRKIGLRQSHLNLFQSYLSYRTQYVEPNV